MASFGGQYTRRTGTKLTYTFEAEWARSDNGSIMWVAVVMEGRKIIGKASGKAIQVPRGQEQIRRDGAASESH